MEKEQNNGSVHNSATGNDVADDQAVAADISARDEYNPNWSNQLPHAHKALQIALQNVVQQTVQDALDSYDFGDWVTSALDNHDFDNHNFDDIVGEAMEERFGELFRQHVKRLSIDCER